MNLHLNKRNTRKWNKHLYLISAQGLIDNKEMPKLIFNELLRPTRSLVFDPGSDKRILSRSKLFTFVFIRHPFERLVSAYEDKFVVNKNQEFINDVLNHNRVNGNNNHVSFGQFVNFVIDELLMDTMSEGSLHWWPYSKLCRMCDIKYSFIGRLEVFIKIMALCRHYIAFISYWPIVIQ